MSELATIARDLEMYNKNRYFDHRAKSMAPNNSNAAMPGSKLESLYTSQIGESSMAIRMGGDLPHVASVSALDEA